MPRWISLGLLTLVAGCLAGCGTAGNFCDVAAPILPSVEDRLTEGTKRQILKHDSYGEQACGWKAR